jgi:hypothetical protein
MIISRERTIWPRAFTDRVQIRRVENDLYKGRLSSSLNSTRFLQCDRKMQTAVLHKTNEPAFAASQ